MKWFFELMLSDFWVFIGGIIIMVTISNFLLILWNRFWRHWNIRKHGYPPAHCDADGDFMSTTKKEK